MKILVEIIATAILFYVFLPSLVSAVDESNYALYIFIVLAWIAIFFLIGWIFDQYFNKNNNGRKWMLLFETTDLELTYHRNNFKGEVDCFGNADFEYFNKFQRQTVVNLINVYAMEHSITDKAHGHLLEKVIREYLPDKISTYESALTWLLENLEYQQLIESDSFL